MPDDPNAPTDLAPVPHMSAEEFRRAGHAAVDWIASYYERLEEFPVLSQVAPGAVRSQLPTHPPQTGEPFDALLEDLDRVVLPGITHWQSPNFFAYFPANASGPAILGDLLSAGLGVQGMLWATSPACTEVETHVLDWLVQMLGLPAAFSSGERGGGVIQDTASSSSLCAVLAARERATHYRSNREGVDQPLVAYTSSQTHSSLEKAMAIAGIGTQGLRQVEVDAQYAMVPDALATQIATDRAAGLTPFFVCATVGTTSSTAIDPVRAIGEICHRESLWLHVDAAHAGSAAICPELREAQDGLELADSYCFNPHKWLLTNFDCDCFYVRDRDALTRTLSVLPEYLKNRASASGEVFDYRDWHVPLGRRFRALKLWAVIRHYGIDGLRAHIRAHIAMARDFERWVDADPQYRLCAPRHFNLVCFAHRRGDAFNQALMDTLNARGRIYLTHTRLGDRLVLRMAIGATLTEPHHVAAAWQHIQACAATLA